MRCNALLLGWRWFGRLRGIVSASSSLSKNPASGLRLGNHGADGLRRVALNAFVDENEGFAAGDAAGVDDQVRAGGAGLNVPSLRFPGTICRPSRRRGATEAHSDLAAPRSGCRCLASLKPLGPRLLIRVEIS